MGRCSSVAELMYAGINACAITWMFAALSTVEPPILELGTARLLEGDKPWNAERLPLVEDRCGLCSRCLLWEETDLSSASSVWMTRSLLPATLRTAVSTLIQEAPMRTSRVPSALLFLLLGTATACSGTPGGGTTSTSSLSGTVANTTFAVGTALAALGPATESVSCGGGADAGESCIEVSSGQGIVIALTNRPGMTCTTDSLFANLDVLDLDVSNANGAVTPGTYAIPAAVAVGSSARAVFSTSTSTCGGDISLLATSGTITLAELSSTHVSGSYDVTFGTQGSFSGSFDLALCDLPDAGVNANDAGVPACLP